MKKIVLKLVVGGLIFNDNKVLILKRSINEDILPGIWELPSGKKEELESVIDALKREIKEETNLDIIPLMPFSVLEYKIEKELEVRDSIQINYLSILKDKKQEVLISSEHQEFAWVGLSELKNYNLTEATRKNIQDGFVVSCLLNNKKSGC